MFIRSRGLPLFTKELLEQAARRRTYVIRVLFVALLSYSTLTTLALQLRSISPLNVLGQGLPILRELVDFEFTAIYLFLPAMACGVFTSEKERNTLALLFLTRLGPWTIIIEKLLSRLFPMLMFLCCALPVMAFLYSMGGLTFFQLFVSAYYLLAALFLLGCVAVMCSALTHSTASAFVRTYVALFLIGIAPSVVSAFIPQQISLDVIEFIVYWSSFDGLQRGPGASPLLYSYGLNQYILTLAFSPSKLWMTFMNQWSGGMGTLTPWGPAVVLGFPSFLAGLCCLLVARWALYRRAFVAPSNPLLKFFRGLDKIFFWANRKVAFDVKLVKEADTLPDFEPIAWREVSKRSLGQFRYLVRIMIPLLFPVIFVGAFIVESSDNPIRMSNGGIGLAPLVLFLGGVQLVLVTVTAANSIPMERMRQTWDVLRSLPLTGREILLQKLRGVRRLQWVCGIPVLAAIGLQTWLRAQLGPEEGAGSVAGTPLAARDFPWWEYLIGAVACVWIYSELAKWTALRCGLMIRTPMRAILVAFPAIVIVSCVPSLVLFLIVQYGFMTSEDLLNHDNAPPLMMLIGTTSPVLFVSMNELGNIRMASPIPLLPAIVNIVWQGTLVFLLRRHMLHRAEWYLGRIGVPVKTRPARTIAAATPLGPQPADLGADGGSVRHVAGTAS